MATSSLPDLAVSRASLAAGSPRSASPAALDIFDTPDRLPIIRTNKIWRRDRMRCAGRGHRRRTDPRGPALHPFRPSCYRLGCPREEHSTADRRLAGGVGAMEHLGRVF